MRIEEMHDTIDINLEARAKEMPGEINQQIPEDIDNSAKDQGDNTQQEELQRLELLYLILNFFKNVDDSYPLGIILDHGEIQGYEKETILTEIQYFAKKQYICLETASGSSEVEQLLTEKIFNKILVKFGPKGYGILLDNFKALNNNLFALSSKCEETNDILSELKKDWNEYNASKQTIEQAKEDINAKASAFDEQKDKVKKEIDDFWKKWSEIKKTLKEEALKHAEEKIETELKMSGRIGKAMQDMQKDIIQFMVIFITIFTMVGIDIKNIGQWSIWELLLMNLVICASMSTLISLVSIIMGTDKDRTCRIISLAVILWILVLAGAFFTNRKGIEDLDAGKNIITTGGDNRMEQGILFSDAGTRTVESLKTFCFADVQNTTLQDIDKQPEVSREQALQYDALFWDIIQKYF